MSVAGETRQNRNLKLSFRPSEKILKPRVYRVPRCTCSGPALPFNGALIGR